MNEVADYVNPRKAESPLRMGALQANEVGLGDPCNGRGVGAPLRYRPNLARSSAESKPLPPPAAPPVWVNLAALRAASC